MFKKPFNRVVGGNGTYADPFVVRNDLARELDQIPQGGYDYELGQIKKVRQLFEQTEMTDEQRERFAVRIDTKELLCRAMRPRYLLSRAKEEKRHRLGTPQKEELFKQRAKDAYADFKKFADDHPEITAEYRANSHWSEIFQPPQELK